MSAVAPDQSARFAAMAVRARTRAAIERDGRATPAEEGAAVRAADEWRHRDAIAAGPPNGCHGCYEWGWNYAWWKGFVATGAVHAFGDWYHVRRDGAYRCRCECHGPRGLYIHPPIAIA